MSRVRGPSGVAPPASVALPGGRTVDLRPIAAAVCGRYHDEFRDEGARYGPAGREWCVHDNLYLLAWAIADAELGDVDLESQVRWLAGVLASRSFPLERLARDLEIAADELAAAHPELGASAESLRAAAPVVRELAADPPAA